MRIRRRSLSRAAAAVSAGIYAAALPASAATDPAVLPMQFTNQTGCAGAVYRYELGMD